MFSDFVVFLFELLLLPWTGDSLFTSVSYLVKGGYDTDGTYRCKCSTLWEEMVIIIFSRILLCKKNN